MITNNDKMTKNPATLRIYLFKDNDIGLIDFILIIMYGHVAKRRFSNTIRHIVSHGGISFRKFLKYIQIKTELI